ncbi:MAG: hypothetical protein VKN56_10460 [Cyanobacteriota bacterium]|nr:hypothetical protein [Cyanobacteriota bacterium]
MGHTLILRLLHGSIPLAIALALSPALPAVEASSRSCSEDDLNDPAFQRRPDMDRCEGIDPTKPIAAHGLHLSSYAIGQATPQKRERGGSVLSLQVPVSPPGLPEPTLIVTAVKDNYLMEPLLYTAPKQGWKGFTWGTEVLRKRKISASRLRALALLKPDGDAHQLLPVRFGPASSYNLVISSTTALKVTTMRILSPKKEIVAECISRATRLDQDLPCPWRAANLPAGTYTFLARDEHGKEVLNQLLRHDPRWLKH